MLIYELREIYSKGGRIWGWEILKIEREEFKKQEKKLKKYHDEMFKLNKIILHIKQSSTYEDLYQNPMSKIYGFEALKDDMCGYYSFNLCKKGGTIRLIVSIDKENKIVRLEYISTDHYSDFKRKLRTK